MSAQHSSQTATAGSQTVTAALLSEFALTQVQYLMEEMGINVYVFGTMEPMCTKALRCLLALLS